MDSRTRYVLALTASIVMLAVPRGASADPPILTSVSGTCDPTVGSSDFTTTPVSGVHQDLDYRVKVDGGPGVWPGGAAWSGPSIYWSYGLDLPDGTSESGTVECPDATGPFNYEIDWYDRPTPPVSFTGMMPKDSALWLGIVAQDPANYLLSATSTGDIGLPGDPDTIITASGIAEPVGGPGPIAFRIDSEGSPATFTLNISEQAPSAYFDENPFYVTKDGPVDRTFVFNGPANVQAELLVDGTPVRLLLNRAEGPVVDVNWDLKDGNGVPVSDGYQEIKVTASNSVGSASYDDVFMVDRSPPSVSIVAPSHPGNLHVFVNDYPSGLKSTFISIDGVSQPVSGQNVDLSRRVDLGTHSVTVGATDRAGHTTSKSKTFTVTPTPPPPAAPKPVSCRDGAKTAIRRSPSLVRRLRRLGHLGHRDVFKGFAIREALCPFFGGRGPNDKVILMKQRHGDLTPLVVALGDGHGGWAVSYSSTKPRITSISLVNNDLMERRRIGRHTKLVHLRWDGHTLVAVR